MTQAESIQAAQATYQALAPKVRARGFTPSWIRSPAQQAPAMSPAAYARLTESTATLIIRG